VGIDFSLSNLTFSNQMCLHTTKAEKQSDYKDILGMIQESFNVVQIPVFGVGGLTIPNHKGHPGSSFFPVSMDLRQPLLSKDHLVHDYVECLKKIELACPSSYAPLIQFCKSVAKRSLDKAKSEQG